MATTTTDPQSSSNVRETFALMSSLVYPKIPLRYMQLCARILQQRHMETVFEERVSQSLCAFPPCVNALTAKRGRKRISLARREIYDAKQENQFCSPTCMNKAKVYLSQLVNKPPQLVPSLMEIFGTNTPNPFDFEDDISRMASAQPAAERPRAAIPKATSVWSKTDDLGIVERRTPKFAMGNDVAAVAARSMVAPPVKENTNVAPPDREFPTAEHAVLIEGFVFPSHKQPLAKKVERLLQKDTGERGSELVVSDSDESGDDSSDADSDAGSFVLSDFDEDEVVTLKELSHFVNLWRLFSTWITHETNLVVAGRPIPAPEKSEESEEDKEKIAAAERAAQQVKMERSNAFSMLMNRPMPQAALKLKLPSDRYINQKIYSITSTFSLREAIDGRNSHQWICVAVILLLVAHGKKPEDIAQDSQIQEALEMMKLDEHELQQLLALFYEIRGDDDVVVDLDVAPLKEDIDEIARKTQDKSSPQVKICRKCRRASDKCVCKKRASAPQEDFSTSDVQEMLQQALSLREEYEELLDA